MPAHPSSPAKGAAGASGRELIIDAAGQILSTNGLDAITLDAVAARARVPEQMITRWWPSEDALALDVLRREWVTRAAHVRRAALRFGI